MTNTALTSNAPDLETLKKWDRLHQIHPWAAIDSWRGYDNMFVDSADGIYFWDGAGKRYIDGPGGMWCSQIGYGRKEMADAISDQVIKLPFTSPFTNSTQPSAILSKKIADMAPGDLNNVFFTTGGSTAVDTALRTMQYFNNRRGLPEKKMIIAREKGYHGSTYLAHSVTGKERDKSHFDFATNLVQFLPDVNPYIRPDGMSIEDWCDAKVEDLREMIKQIGADKIGAFIAEPILSSGGVIVPAQGDEPSAFTNGYTYSAHPVSCAAALKNIEIFENERILENVRNVSPHFQHRLKDLMKYDIVGDARGMGLLGCIECKAEDLEAERSLGSKIDEACEELGLLVRPLINMAVFSPPLIITIEQIDEMFDILEAAIIKVENNL